MSDIIREGEMLMIEGGEYDDYRRYGPYVVLRDFSITASQIAFLRSVEAEYHDIGWRFFDWLSWLESSEYVTPKLCVRVYLGCDYEKCEVTRDYETD